jgi:hypothetical protein
MPKGYKEEPAGIGSSAEWDDNASIRKSLHTFRRNLMSRLFVVAGLMTGIALGSIACGNASRSPSAPTGTAVGMASSQGTSTTASRSPTRTHGQRLIAVLGTGSGIVNVTPTAAVDGSFSAQIQISVHGAPAHTTFYVQRAPELGRPNSADGVCQRAAGLPPWGPPAPNFVTFPLPATGPLVTLHTSAGGSGTAHIDFTAPAIADGTQFDVMFRLVDSLTAPTNDLRTGCFTVTVK